MKKLFLILSTILKLGIINVIYVAWYKVSLKVGLRKFKFKQRKFNSNSDFFYECNIKSTYPDEWKKELLRDADKIIKGEIRYYAYHWKKIGNPPNWFLNPFNDIEYPNSNFHWTNLPDFHPILGDIKNVWEASRFEWVITLAKAYAVSNDKKYLQTLNEWLRNWINKNPINIGPNWKCGQEASIRVFALLNTAYILNQYSNPSSSLLEFIEISLERINNNILYSIAQDNNHGTSEATALYIGSTWINSLKKVKKYKTYSKRGRYWLENRVKKLISNSGSFSQHSITYHRVVLDTLSFAEFWRRKLEDKHFSKQFYNKAILASKWLYTFTDYVSGDAPNLGPNDGALLLNTNSCDYRDFRPSLQLSAKLFLDEIWFERGKYNESLFWFNLDYNNKFYTPHKKAYSSHGYTYLDNNISWCLVKWPYFKFRPSHNDNLHFDLWYKGINIISDSGSFSYNPGENLNLSLGSVNSHNTVSFNSREQMKQISRFLQGGWLKSKQDELIFKKDSSNKKWIGAYKDLFGNTHKRCVSVNDNSWIIEDELSGNFKTAKIGFNLNFKDIKFEKNTIMSNDIIINFPIDLENILIDNIVSDYYFEKHIINRIEIIINKPGVYSTEIKLKT